MKCPTCKSKNIKITQTIELPPDGINDEITLQTVECEHCDFYALAVYRESRRGALDSESWVHEGLRVSEGDFQTIRELIQSCPSPSDKRCQCESHQVLGHQTDYRWDGLDHSGVEIKDMFILR
ncbi:MAG: hypothetical protein CL609_09675 [Anaerolineaceae bacterium]|nr:hypothetical protein [Anaerolineaceae bacterium]